MESEQSIRGTVEDISELVLRMVYGVISVLATLGLGGYFTYKAVINILQWGGADSLTEFISSYLIILILYGLVGLIGSLLLVWGIWTFIKGFKEYPKASALHRRGQEVEGVVVELRKVEETSVWDISFFLMFNQPDSMAPAFHEVCAYQVGGQTYRVRKQIPEERARRIEVGSKVQVRYLPGDPEVAQIRKMR